MLTGLPFQFYLYSNTIAETATYQFEAAQHAFTSLSEEITAYSQMKDDSEFPFVTMGLYESNAQHAREQSGAKSMTFHPVKNDDRFFWEQYSVDHQDWIETSRTLISQGQVTVWGRANVEDHPTIKDEPISPFIHYHNELGENVRSSSWQEVSNWVPSFHDATLCFLKTRPLFAAMTSSTYLHGKARRHPMILALSISIYCRYRIGQLYLKLW